MTPPAKSGYTTTLAPPRTKVPRYRAICDDLKKRILDGQYEVDARLPSEKDLMAEYGASRVTVRHALQRLAQEHLIHSQKGKGHFVSYPKTVQNLGRLLGLGETVSPRGMTVSSKVLKLGEEPADADVAEALEIQPGDTVTSLQRLRKVNGQPVSLDVSYFPTSIGRYLGDYDLENQDVFVLIEDYLGLELSIADLIISFDKADAGLAKTLGIATGDSVVVIERLTSDRKGRPIDFEYLYGRIDAFQFHIRVPRW
jgi:GntR family transcriptional regulator